MAAPQEVGVGGLQAQGPSGKLSKTLSQNKRFGRRTLAWHALRLWAQPPVLRKQNETTQSRCGDGCLSHEKTPGDLSQFDHTIHGCSQGLSPSQATLPRQCKPSGCSYPASLPSHLRGPTLRSSSLRPDCPSFECALLVIACLVSSVSLKTGTSQVGMVSSPQWDALWGSRHELDLSFVICLCDVV